MCAASRKTDPANDEFQVVYQTIKAEFPDFKIVYKSTKWWMSVIDVFLKVITLNRMTAFLETYTTTIGNTVYVGTNWPMNGPYARSVTLRHEAVHMRQRRRYGLFLFALTYLFLPLPVIFAVGRRNIERAGYEESLRAYADYYGIKILRENHIRLRIVEQFTSSSYFWMWPFQKSVNRWYDEFVSKLEKEWSENSNAQTR